MSERIFEHEGKKYKVVKPTLDTRNKAGAMRSKVFNEALQRGDLLRSQLESELEKRGLWTKELQAKYDTLAVEVGEATKQLKAGGMKLQEAKDLAFEIQDKRGEMVSLLTSRSELDANTCEGQADSASFNFSFIHSVCNEDGSKLFPNGESDFQNYEDAEFINVASVEFYYLMSESDDVTKTLPENQFLKQFEFVNEEHKLVDKNGRLVNREGKHINEAGYYIKWTGTGEEDFHYVDIDGNKTNGPDDEHSPIEFGAFLDDEGKPLRKKKKKAANTVTA